MPDTLHIFSYGTLQPGQRYWADIADLIDHVEPATLEGYALWHFPQRGYPAITPNAGSKVHGSLLTANPTAIDQLLQCCDNIEGVESRLYVRECLPVTPQTSSQTLAFVYVYHPTRVNELHGEGQRIEDGHWLNMMRTHDRA